MMTVATDPRTAPRLAGLAMLAALAACTATTKEYSELAKGGQAFTAAMVPLSEEALDSRARASVVHLRSNASGSAAARIQAFETMHKEDKAWGETLKQLRDVSDGLSTYFVHLGKLADSTAPADAAKDVEAAADGLGTILAAIGVTVPENAASGLNAGAKALLEARVNYELRRAIGRDAARLRAAADAQRAQINSLAVTLVAEDVVTRRFAIRTDLPGAFATRPPSNPADTSAWQAAYTASITPSTAAATADAARLAADELVKALDEITAEELTPERAASFAARMQLFLKAIQSLRSK
jgi:hypothetical protein